MFEKATKRKSKLRCAIFGPSGAGKTFSALRIAKGLGGKIALVDTEFGSASKYADRFDFDVCNLGENQSIETYITAMVEAGKAGYNVLIVDSLTHSWQQLLEEIEKLAQTKYRGNSWGAWREGTPRQRSMVKAIQSSPCHVIATMRSKTEWETSKNDQGRVQIQRMGLAPDEGKGIEYEFDLLLELNTEHKATIIKDRTGKYQDAIIDKVGEEFGKELAAWLAEGVDMPVAKQEDTLSLSDPLPTGKSETTTHIPDNSKVVYTEHLVVDTPVHTPPPEGSSSPADANEGKKDGTEHQKRTWLWDYLMSLAGNDADQAIQLLGTCSHYTGKKDKKEHYAASVQDLKGKWLDITISRAQKELGGQEEA